MIEANPDILRLIQLDEFDHRIHRLQKERDYLPTELEPFQREKDRLADEIEKIGLLLKHIQAEIDAFELDVKTNMAQIGKYRMQQNSAKTNIEYSTLKKQIKALEVKNGEIEETALEGYLRLDDLRDRRVEAKKRLETQNVVLKKETAGVTEDVAKVNGKLDTAIDKRTAVYEQVNPGVRNLYDRIMKKASKGRALATINGKQCQGCYLELPSSRVTEVVARREVVMCPQCSLILYSNK